MILYHASTVKIKDFYVPYGGIHMGGIHSALEAALRKVRNYCGSGELEIYVHRLEVDLGRVVAMDDMGDCQAWRDTINSCTRDGYNSVEYKNLFEPDTCNSYMIWEPERIEILSVEPMNQDEAEDIVNDFYDAFNL
jgi:hypothetical protein